MTVADAWQTEANVPALSSHAPLSPVLFDYHFRCARALPQLENLVQQDLVAKECDTPGAQVANSAMSSWREVARVSRPESSCPLPTLWAGFERLQVITIDLCVAVV